MYVQYTFLFKFYNKKQSAFNISMSSAVITSARYFKRQIQNKILSNQ